MRSLTLLETRDTVHEQVMVAVHDTLMVTKTITIRENEAGDTIRMTTVMDRERVRSVADVRSKKEEARVVDSIYIERNDSIRTQNARFTAQEESQSSSLVSVLKWVLAMMVVLSMLIVIVRLKV